MDLECLYEYIRTCAGILEVCDSLHHVKRHVAHLLCVIVLSLRSAGDDHVRVADGLHLADRTSRVTGPASAQRLTETAHALYPSEDPPTFRLALVESDGVRIV